MVERRFGWRPDKPDFRDKVCTLKAVPNTSKNIDLRKTGNLPPVYDQGQSSSCTGNAIAAAVQYGLKAQSKSNYIPSRLFIYYNERMMEGTEAVDAGAEIRDGIKVVASIGAPPEDVWPFDLVHITTKPSDKAYDEALKGIIKQYSRVPVKLANIKNVLSHNIPIVFGIMLYDSFMTDNVAKDGMVPMPKVTEKAVGGHAMMIVGTTDTHFIVRNSWGMGWGDGGYCYMPHDYVTNENLAADFWAIFLS